MIQRRRIASVTPRTRSRALTPIALAATLFWATVYSLPAVAKERLATPLFVDVQYVDEQGSAQLIERIERALLERLATHSCYDEINLVSEDSSPSETDLVLAVELFNVEEQSDFDLSIAAMSDPNAGPNADRRFTARLQIDYRSRLRVGAEGPEIRSRTMRSIGAHRPLLDEDPRLEAQDKAIFDLTRGMGRFSCKGGPKKVQRALDSALAKSGS